MYSITHLYTVIIKIQLNVIKIKFNVVVELWNIFLINHLGTLFCDLFLIVNVPMYVLCVRINVWFCMLERFKNAQCTMHMYVCCTLYLIQK